MVSGLFSFAYATPPVINGKNFSLPRLPVGAKGAAAHKSAEAGFRCLAGDPAQTTSPPSGRRRSLVARTGPKKLNVQGG